jgi:hypothetical protein
MSPTKKNTRERGVSLYIAFMIMTALMGISFGMSAILFSQLGILKGIGHSVFAFFATEAGVEHALYLDNSVCATEEDHAPCLTTAFLNIPPQQLILSNGARYKLTAEAGGQGGCPVERNYCVKSVGTYQQAQRAVRVAR